MTTSPARMGLASLAEQAGSLSKWKQYLFHYRHPLQLLNVNSEFLLHRINRRGEIGKAGKVEEEKG